MASWSNALSILPALAFGQEHRRPIREFAKLRESVLVAAGKSNCIKRLPVGPGCFAIAQIFSPAIPADLCRQYR
jgi:hypothetical protein